MIRRLADRFLEWVTRGLAEPFIDVDPDDYDSNREGGKS